MAVNTINPTTDAVKSAKAVKSVAKKAVKMEKALFTVRKI